MNSRRSTILTALITGNRDALRELARSGPRHFGVVDYKVSEADFFLDEVAKHCQTFNIHKISYCTSAFVSATRSITFAMQAVLRSNDHFNIWYAARQEALKKDPLVVFFGKYRTVSQHLGADLVGGGTCAPGCMPVHYFVPCSDLRIVPDLDVASACSEYFRTILTLVCDCYMEFATIVNGQWYFTESNFRELGKTVNDALAELGYPPDWIRAARAAEVPDCELWRLLRAQADGCGITQILEARIGRSPPQPASASLI